MNLLRLAASPTRPSVLHTLAHLLERLDRSGDAAADQYRVVALRLGEELRTAAPGGELEAVLATHPAAAELYENLSSRHAGLCRSPLEASLNAELATTRLLERVRQGTAPR